eukprot:350120-Chlamydomonas_euryale.AAC.4
MRARTSGHTGAPRKVSCPLNSLLSTATPAEVINVSSPDKADLEATSEVVPEAARPHASLLVGSTRAVLRIGDADDCINPVITEEDAEYTDRTFDQVMGSMKLRLDAAMKELGDEDAAWAHATVKGTLATMFRGLDASADLDLLNPVCPRMPEFMTPVGEASSSLWNVTDLLASTTTNSAIVCGCRTTRIGRGAEPLCCSPWR